MIFVRILHDRRVTWHVLNEHLEGEFYCNGAKHAGDARIVTTEPPLDIERICFDCRTKIERTLENYDGVPQITEAFRQRLRDEEDFRRRARERRRW